jgi:predicted ribosome quality control (RQC) complex YloA/Tae2 family protein
MKLVVRYIEAIKQNIEFYVGENAEDNFEIIDVSDPDDIWFHMTNISSCHVVAKLPDNNNFDKKQMRKIIVQGAELCKRNSKLNAERDVEITYTKIKNLEKTDIIGSVSIHEFKTIKI